MVSTPRILSLLVSFGGRVPASPCWNPQLDIQRKSWQIVCVHTISVMFLLGYTGTLYFNLCIRPSEGLWSGTQNHLLDCCYVMLKSSWVVLHKNIVLNSCLGLQMHSGNYSIINCRCLCLISRGQIVRVARRICRGWMTRMWWRAAFVWVLEFSSLVIWTYQDEAKAVLKLLCACSQPDWTGALNDSFLKVETKPGGQVHVCLSILYLKTFVLYIWVFSI